MKKLVLLLVLFVSAVGAFAQRNVIIADPIDGGTGGTVIYPTTCSGSPTLSAVTVGQTSATISYTRNGTATHYIDYRVYGTTTWTSFSTTNTTQTITGLACNTQYYFRIRKACPNGGFIYSTTLLRRTLACITAVPTLSAPTYKDCSGLSAVAPNRFDVTLSWGMVSGASSYQLQYRKTGTSVWQSQTVTTLHRQLPQLAAGTYEWKVKANNSTGVGISNPTINFTIDPIQIQNTFCNPDEICWESLSLNCPQRYVVSYTEWVATSIYEPHIGWELVGDYVNRSVTVYPSNTSMPIPADACDINVVAVRGNNLSEPLYFGPSCRRAAPTQPTNTKETTTTLTLYPNPTTGSFTVEHPIEIVQLEVVDMTGRRVWTGSTNGSTTTAIHLSELPAGIYLVKADNGMIQKLVKQ